MVEECSELVHVPHAGEGLLRPVASVDELVTDFQEYQKLVEKLLVSDDYQKISDKEFKKKSAWRKLSKAFGISDNIVEKIIERDEAGRVFYAEFTVEATAPNGRQTTGWGSCSIRERDFSKPDHDIPATAHTRAKNRAISDMIGAGEVSAEEMIGEKATKKNPAPKEDDGLTTKEMKEHIKDYMLTMYGKEGAMDELEELTTFKDKKTGEVVKGKRQLEKLTAKQTPFIYREMKERFEAYVEQGDEEVIEDGVIVE